MHRLTSILHFLGLSGRAELFSGVSDADLPALTDAQLSALGFEDEWDRRRLLAAFAPAKAPRSSREMPRGEAADRPFINSLGHPLAPVPAVGVFFAIWPVRVGEYALYCGETRARMPSPDFPQADDHPVVDVNWNDAAAFCTWLTIRERNTGLLPQSLEYRLPRDVEWSAAVGLTGESGHSPAERNGMAAGYPWGRDFPPPRGAGNYHPSLGCEGFFETSPVGSFAPNEFALCDLGGNVWEWCLDEYQRGCGERVARGASWSDLDQELLKSSHRARFEGRTRRNNLGFRVVLTGRDTRDPWTRTMG